jgi:succinate dehydrogenase assembly factor 2
MSKNALYSALRTWSVTTRTSRHLSSTARRFKDPWILPNTPEHEKSTQSPPNLPPPTPIPRPNETVETLRARLVYQSRKRGTLESDLLLSTFAQENLTKMSEAELKEYDKVRLEYYSVPVRYDSDLETDAR